MRRSFRRNLYRDDGCGEIYHRQLQLADVRAAGQQDVGPPGLRHSHLESARYQLRVQLLGLLRRWHYRHTDGTPMPSRRGCVAVSPRERLARRG